LFPIFKNAAIVPSKKRKVNVCLSPKDYLNTTASSIIKNLYHLFPAGLTNIFAAAILDSMKKKWILVSITVAAVLAYWLLFSGISADELDTFIRGFGPWAPLAYVAAFTVLPAFFFPVAVLALAGGLLFGFWAGAAYTFLGAVLNCTLMFFLARRLGKKQVERMLRSRLGERADRIFSFLEGRRGFLFLVLLRLIPAFPYNLINYAYGLSAMDYKTYILASAIGIIPGTFAFINIGDHMLDLSSPGFWTSLGLMALLLFVTAALGKFLFPNNAKIKINTNGEKNETK
jgi:dedA family protein